MIKLTKLFIIAALMFTIGLSLSPESALAAEQPNQIEMIQLSDSTSSAAIRDFSSADDSLDNGLFRKRYKGETVEDPETGEHIAVVRDRKTGRNRSGR